MRVVIRCILNDLLARTPAEWGCLYGCISCGYRSSSICGHDPQSEAVNGMFAENREQ